ncbi:MAG: hypothetical protein IKN96_08490 [Oscillibacter sp.]|nr:hypothetical protein [Oscillibacter sp.]
MKAWTKGAALALAVLITLAVAAGCAKKQPEPAQEEEAPKRNLVIGYAEEGVTVAESEDELNKSVRQMLEDAAEPGMPLSYKNNAFSEDGVNFSCYIANADEKYDMFFQIFADEALQDEIFLSQLIRPGQAFESITLSHALPKRTVTRCYVSQTRVELVDGEQTIHDQVFFTMDFNVI